MAIFKGYIKLWNFDGRQIQLKYPEETSSIRTSAISNDGKRVLFHRPNKPIEIWDVDLNTITHTIECKSWPDFISFDAINENVIYTYRNEVYIFKIETGNTTTVIHENRYGRINAVSIVYKNNHLITSDDNNIRIWDINTGNLVNSIDSIQGNLKDIVLSSNLQYIVNPLGSEGIKIIDLSTKEDFAILGGSLPLRLSPDGKHIAISDHNKIRIYHIAKGKKEYSIPNNDKILFCSFFNGGESILAATDNNSVTAWRTEDNKEIFRLQHAHNVRSVAIDSDQEYFVFILDDGSITIRDFDNLSKISSCQPHQKLIRSFAFSPDKERFITGGSGSIKIWNTKKGLELLTLSRDISIREIAFTEDGQSIINARGERIDIKEINQAIFSPPSRNKLSEQKDHEVTKSLSQSLNLDFDQIVSLVKTLPDGTNTKTSTGEAILDFYVERGRFDVAKYLINEQMVEFPKANIFYSICRRQSLRGEGEEKTAKKKDFVSYLLEKGFAIDSKTRFGYTALHIAILYDYLQIAEFLVENGADVNQQDGQKRTPLLLYLAQPKQRSLNTDFVSMLLENGADINTESQGGYTPLHYAVSKNQIDIIKILLENGAKPNKANDDGLLPINLSKESEITELLAKYSAHSSIPIHKAIINKDIEKLKELINSNKLLVNMKDNEGKTALYLAVNNGFKEGIELLHKHGAVSGNKAIDAIVDNNQIDIVDAIRQNPEILSKRYAGSQTLLHLAVRLDRTEMVDYFIHNGVEVNAQDDKGYTPLDYVSSKQQKTVQILKENGGKRAVSIHKAALRGDLEAIKSIVSENKDIIDSKDVEEMTALQWAAIMGHTDVVEYLLVNGATVKNTNQFAREIEEYGYSDVSNLLYKYSEMSSAGEFDKAVLTKNTELLKKILEQQPEVIKGTSGSDALLSASRSGDTHVVELLLKYGVDVDAGHASMSHNHSPLYVSIAYGHSNIAELLIKNGGRIETKGLFGIYGGTDWERDIIPFDQLSTAVVDENKQHIEQALSSSSLIQRKGVNNLKAPRSLLFYAVQKSKINSIEALIENGINPNVNFNDDPYPPRLPSSTPLHWAVKNGNKEIVEYLINNGADINGKTFCPPLSWAAIYNQPDMALLLIKKGADVNAKDSYQNGATPLYLAAENGHFQIVKILIENGAEINTQTNNGVTPLYQAAKNGFGEIVQLLIENGADINMKNKNDETALHAATQTGSKEIAELLINNGANINDKISWQRRKSIQGSQGRWTIENLSLTPLDIAARWNYPGIARMLIENGVESNSAMQRAIENGHKQIVKLLIETDAKYRSNLNESLLLAVRLNKLDVVAHLISLGADVNTRDTTWGSTVLMWAADKGNMEIVKLLLEKGADVNAKDTAYGKTALMWAADKGHSEIVKFLLEKGADVNAKDTSWGSTALIWAADEGDYETVKLLLDKGVNIDTKDTAYGKTALAWASEKGRLKIVEYLVEKGADLNITNKHNQTPLDIASIYGHKEIADFLKKRTEHSSQFITDKELISAPEVVGNWGAKEHLIFEGNKSFSKNQICKQIFMETDVILALSPQAPFASYLNILQKKIAIGYQNNGFYEPQVNVSFDDEQQKIVVKIQEGARYKKSQIIITGADDSLKRQLAERLHSEDMAELYTDVSDVVMNLLKGTFRFPFTWNETDWVCFDKSFIEPAKQYIDQLLNLMGYYNAEFDLKVVPVHEELNAELHINFANSGIKAEIGTIDISGNKINTDEQVISFLNLKEGMSLNSILVKSIESNLRESGRFRKYQVISQINETEPKKSILELILDEIPSTTPLDKNLTEKEELVLRVGKFFSDYKNWNEDMHFTLPIANKHKYLPFTIEGTISPQKGFILIEKDDDTIVSCLAVHREKIQYVCPMLGRHILSPKPKEKVVVQFKVAPDNERNDGWVMFFGGGFESDKKGKKINEPIYDIQLDIPPAAWLHTANKGNTQITYVDQDTVLIEIKGDKDTYPVITANRKTGKIREISIKGSSGSSYIRFQKGLFNEHVKKIQEQIDAASLESVQTKGLGITLLHSFLPLYLTHSSPNTLTLEQKKSATNIWNRILAENITTCFTGNAQIESEDDFSFPRYEAIGSAGNMMRFLTGTIFSLCHENLAQDHWLRILSHITVLVTSDHGQSESVRNEMQMLYTSDKIGPVGYYLIAKVFQKFGHPAYHSFTERSWQSLSAEDFCKDWEPLITGESKLASNLRCSLSKFRTSEPNDIRLVASLFPKESASLFETAVQCIKESKDTEIVESLKPLLNKLWQNTVKEGMQRELTALNPQLSIKYLSNFIQKDPNDSIAYYNRGISYAATGYYNAAITDLNKVIELKPRHSSAYLQRSKVYSQKNDHKLAIADLNKAIELAPNSLDAYMQLMVTYQKLNKYNEDMIEVCEKIIRMKPHFKDIGGVYTILEVCYTKLGQPEKAIIASEKAVKIKPIAQYYNNLGGSYTAGGYFDKAINAYKKAIEIKPDSVSAYQNMSSTYMLLGQYQEALVASNEAISLSPDFLSYRKFGSSLYFLGRYQESIDSCKKSIELNPHFLQAYFDLGNNYVALGDFDEAVKCYKKVISLDPNFVEEKNKYMTTQKVSQNLHKSYIAKEYYNIGMLHYLLGDKNSAIKNYEILKTLDDEIANKLYKVISKNNPKKQQGFDVQNQ